MPIKGSSNFIELLEKEMLKEQSKGYINNNMNTNAEPRFKYIPKKRRDIVSAPTNTKKYTYYSDNFKSKKSKKEKNEEKIDNNNFNVKNIKNQIKDSNAMFNEEKYQNINQISQSDNNNMIINNSFNKKVQNDFNSNINNNLVNNNMSKQNFNDNNNQMNINSMKFMNNMNNDNNMKSMNNMIKQNNNKNNNFKYFIPKSNIDLNEQSSKVNQISNNQFDDLKSQLNEEKNNNKKLQDKINNLNNTITQLKQENKNIITKYENEIKILKDKINQLQLQIHSQNDTNNNVNNDLNEVVRLYKKIEELTEKINRYPLILEKGEKMLSIVFISTSQNVHYSMICKNTDSIHKLEEGLYKEYPNLAEGDNYFLCKGTVVNKFKKFEELNIKNGDAILIDQREI